MRLLRHRNYVTIFFFNLKSMNILLFFGGPTLHVTTTPYSDFVRSLLGVQLSFSSFIGLRLIIVTLSLEGLIYLPFQPWHYNLLVLATIR